MQNLFALLRIGIGTKEATEKECEIFWGLTIDQWRGLMDLAAKQGVAAIAFDGVQKVYSNHKDNLRSSIEQKTEWMRWVAECTGRMDQYEKRSRHQKKVISKLSKFWGAEHIRMMVFKGQANAAMYPIPEHRATGDIDCWLFGDAEKADRLLVEKNVKVQNNWYRHSKFVLKGETIENHRVMSHTRGSKKKKLMEEELRTMISSCDLQSIPGCGMALMPTAQFNACFLTYHGLHHFLTEGLRMKQILDWAVFLNSEQDNVDWPAFNDFCKRYKLDRFAALMNYIASSFLGVKLANTEILVDDKYAQKVIDQTLYDDSYLFNSGKDNWVVRWLLVKNMLTVDRWKYEKIAQENVLKHFWQSMSAFICHSKE